MKKSQSEWENEVQMACREASDTSHAYLQAKQTLQMACENNSSMGQATKNNDLSQLKSSVNAAQSRLNALLQEARKNHSHAKENNLPSGPDGYRDYFSDAQIIRDAEVHFFDKLINEIEAALAHSKNMVQSADSIELQRAQADKGPFRALAEAFGLGGLLDVLPFRNSNSSCFQSSPLSFVSFPFPFGCGTSGTTVSASQLFGMFPNLASIYTARQVGNTVQWSPSFQPLFGFGTLPTLTFQMDSSGSSWGGFSTSLAAPWSLSTSGTFGVPLGIGTACTPVFEASSSCSPTMSAFGVDGYSDSFSCGISSGGSFGAISGGLDGGCDGGFDGGFGGGCDGGFGGGFGS